MASSYASAVDDAAARRVARLVADVADAFRATARSSAVSADAPSAAALEAQASTLAALSGDGLDADGEQESLRLAGDLCASGRSLGATSQAGDALASTLGRAAASNASNASRISAAVDDLGVAVAVDAVAGEFAREATGDGLALSAKWDPSPARGAGRLRADGAADVERHLHADLRGGENSTFSCPGDDAVAAACDGRPGAYDIACVASEVPRCASGADDVDEDAACVLLAWSPANATCACNGTVGGPPAAYGATSHTMVGYYASAFKDPYASELVEDNPLIVGTLAAMRRSARAAKTYSFDSLHDVAAASLPKFVKATDRPFAYAVHLVWNNHSWVTIFTKYKPASPRYQRAVMLLFSLLMIMLSQFLAFVFAYPIGYCEKSEHEDDCGDKANIYDETVAWLTDRDEVQARACFWEPFPDVGAAHCQPILPDPQDIIAKRATLVFLVMLISLPCMVLFDKFFMKYVCAPLHWPDATRKARPRLSRFLDRFMTLVSPEDLARREAGRVRRLSKFKHANLMIAATWDRHLADMRSDDGRKCTLLYNLLRLEHMDAKERVLFYHELKSEGCFAASGRGPTLKMQKPVSVRAKILGTLGFLAALLLPMWWLLIIARKYNGAGSAGRKIKRICYFSTMFWIFYHNFVVEPFSDPDPQALRAGEPPREDLLLRGPGAPGRAAPDAARRRAVGARRSAANAFKRAWPCRCGCAPRRTRRPCQDQRAASRLVRKKLPQTPGAALAGVERSMLDAAEAACDAFVEEHDVARDARADDDFRAIEGVEEAWGGARLVADNTRWRRPFYHAAVVTFGTTMVFMWPSVRAVAVKEMIAIAAMFVLLGVRDPALAKFMRPLGEASAAARAADAAAAAAVARRRLALDDLKAEVVPPESLARTSPLRVNSSYFSRAEETYAVAATANRAADPSRPLPSVFRARAARLIRTMSMKVARVAPSRRPRRRRGPRRARARPAPPRVGRAVEAVALEVQDAHSYASRGDLHARALDVYEHLDRLEDHDGEAAAAAKAGGGKFDKMKVRFIASVKQQMKLGAREIRRSMMS
ncbi:hypothetical protein JL722_14946 [Aureococcus anophagefferens]|nr:hypothetical protein JL722_14946 [Aureococcus anophagefferens]